MITTRDDFMSSQREVKHIASTYMIINAIVVRQLYMDFLIVIVDYTKEQHVYRILVSSAHILLTFCIRIGTFDCSRVFGLVQVFRVPCIIIIGVRIQRTDIGYCGC